MNELQKEFFERAMKEREAAEAAEEARLQKLYEEQQAKEAEKKEKAKKAAEEAERKAEAEAEEIINQIKAKIDAEKLKSETEKQMAEDEKKKAEKREESKKRFEADQKAKKQAEESKAEEPKTEEPKTEEPKTEDDKQEEGDIYERTPMSEAAMPKKSPKFKKGGKKSGNAGRVPQRPQQEVAATEEPKAEDTAEEVKETTAETAAEEVKETTAEVATEEVKETTEVVEEAKAEDAGPEIVEETAVESDEEVTAKASEEVTAEVAEEEADVEKATPESKAAADREAKLQEQADEWQDKYKRLLAEFENARAREAKEASRMYDIGAKAVLEKLLPVVDNFERAIQTIPEEDRERAFEQGVDKIYKQMMTTLEDIGVQPMNAEGTEFNPDLHNAVMHVEDENFGENVVAEEMQKGYMYKDSVLRYSMVKVAN